MRLSLDELEATREKVAKINMRAVRRGWTGRLTVDVAPEPIIETTKNDLGFEIQTVWYDAKITGEPPSYGNHRFIGTLKWDTDAGLITRMAPGYAGVVDRSKLIEGHCDHCKINRHRNDTYLLENTETGEQLQVGSTCIKDFLGWSAQPVLLTDADQRELDSLGGASGGERRWTVDTVLAVAWAAVQAFGYVSANDYSHTPTKYIVLDILDPPTRADRDLAAKIAPYVANAAAQAALIRGWVLSDGFTGNSEYAINLRNIARAESVSAANVGLLVSALTAWARAQAQEIRRQQERQELINGAFGNEKDKIAATVTIKYINHIPGQFGTTTLYTMITQEPSAGVAWPKGHTIIPARYVLKWFSTNGAFGDTTDGKVFSLKATVKGTDTYGGKVSTKITRASLLAEAPA